MMPTITSAKNITGNSQDWLTERYRQRDCYKLPIVVIRESGLTIIELELELGFKNKQTRHGYVTIDIMNNIHDVYVRNW